MTCVIITLQWNEMKLTRAEADRVGGGGGVGVFPERLGLGRQSLLYLNKTQALASTESFSTCAAGRTSQPAGRVCRGRFRLSQTVHRDSAGAAEQATDEVSASPLTARWGLQSWSQ